MGSKKYTLEEIQNKIDLIFGAGLILVPLDQEYLGIRKPLRFIDKDFGEWETAPFNVLTMKNTHPLRSKLRRNSTNFKKYGHENPFGSAEIKEKIKKGHLEKYGVENPMHINEIKNKVVNTNNRKYGCAELIWTTESYLKENTLKSWDGLKFTMLVNACIS